MSQGAPGNVLLSLAVEAVLPALSGCAEVLRGGVTTAGLVERGLNLFGKQIAARWYAWSRGQDDEARRAALNDLAALSQEEARRQAADGLTRLAPDARPQDRIAASAYLAAIPRTLDRVWRDEEPTRVWSPGTVSWEEPNGLLAALPADAPPYDPPCDLPSSPYRLEQLLGAGGFGAVYRAAAASLQHLPFAVKFCLDPALAPALHQERANLERLMKAGRDPGALRVVRLYGYDLAHATPYLVYEYVPGGDLDRHVRGRRRLHGRSLRPAEVLAIIRQVAEGLAFAHRHGLVHRDLKPGNILVDGQLLKLADFGLGAAAMARVARVAEAVAPQNGHEESAATLRHSQFRAAGTPLYMSPEQREGAPPDPRHDIYSLGVMWHQLLADDLTRELQSGWAKDLSVRYAAPRGHLKLIERCVGPFDDRPKDGGELCEILNIVAAEASATPPVLPPSMEVRPIHLPAAPVVVTPVSPRPEPPLLPAEGPLLDRLVGQVRRVRRDLDDLPRPPTPPHVVLPPGPREECAKMLRQLLQAHRAAAHFLSPPNKAAAALIALGAACLFGWFAAAVFRLVSQSQFNPAIALNGTFPWGAFTVGLVSAVAACALAVVAQQQLWHWRLRAAQEGVTSAAHRLADRFPDLVRVWGGVVVLHDPEVVARLLRDVEPAEFV